jgi:hypothetical protein
MSDSNQTVQIIPPNETPEERARREAQSQPGSAFTTGAKPSPTGPVAPSGTQQARAAQEAGPSKGTGFTGVGRYLQANVGSRLGEKVAGRVAQTGQQAATRLGQSVQQFQQQLGTRPTEPGQQGTGLYGQLSSQQQAAQDALRKISSGEMVNVSPEQQAAYAAVAGGQFRAPTGLTDIGDIQSQAQLASKLAQGTQTATGRTGLLQQVVGRGPQQYTKGKSALDALILGQAGGELAGARRATAGLERQAMTQEQLAAEQARQFGAETAGAKAALTGEAGGIEKTTSGDISRQQTEYQDKLTELYGKLQQEVEAGEISQETAQMMSNLGVDPQTLPLYGVNLAELKNVFQRKSAGDITAATSGTREQLQKINALRSLSGQTPLYSSEELEKAGTTIDPLTGLSLSEKDLETIREQQKEAVKRAVEDSKRKLDEVGLSSYGLFARGIRGGTEGRGDLYEDYKNLYDPESGKVNEAAARNLMDFWKTRTGWRRTGFLGTGPGAYDPIAGDPERIAALQKLLSETSKTFKIKE